MENEQSFLSRLWSKILEYEKTSYYLAYVYALIANICLVIMQAMMKISTKTFNPFFILYFRGIFLILINTYFIQRSGL